MGMYPKPEVSGTHSTINTIVCMYMYYNITALTTHLYKECTNLQCILVVHSYVVGKSQLESELVLILEHSSSSLFLF